MQGDHTRRSAWDHHICGVLYSSCGCPYGPHTWPVRNYQAQPMDASEKDDFDLQGRIGCFSLSDLLQTLSFTQKTGTLTLIQGWNTRTICYEQGRITYLAAATRLPTAVELLLQSGRLDQKRLLHVLGPNWKRMLGVLDPEHVAPDSEPAAAVVGVNGNGSGGSRRLRQPSYEPGANVTDPYLNDFDDLEAFVPPDYSASPAARNAP